MRSPATPEQVLDDLGDKVVHALAASVSGAANDLAEYRRELPHLVSRHGSRGLANWMHDQMWAHVRARLDDHHGVLLMETGPTREVQLGLRYRIRLKKHTARGAIRSYPTQGALSFYAQEPDLLTELGIATVNLCAGYEWNEELREVVGPVLSLREGLSEDIIWMIDLPSAPGSAGDGVLALPPAGGPSRPVIETGLGASGDEESETP